MLEPVLIHLLAELLQLVKLDCSIDFLCLLIIIFWTNMSLKMGMRLAVKGV